MTNGFLDIPQPVLGNICTFLHECSLLRLREVCKATERSVSTLISSYKTVISKIWIRPKANKTKMKISFLIISEREYFLWELCFTHLLHHLGMDFSVLERIVFFKKLVLILTLDEARRFLENLIPHSSKTIFDRLYFNANYKGGSDIARICMEYFKTKTFRFILIQNWVSEENDSMAWLDFLRNSSVKHVIFRYIKFTRGSDFIQFMVSLASMVAWIDVVVSKSGFTSPYVVPFVHEMMDRKCNTLRFEDEQSPISLADTEKLVQFIHHLEKKVRISVLTEHNEPIDVVVGEYRYKARGRDAVIEHLE